MKEDNVYIFKINFNPVEMISNACSESTWIDDFGFWWNKKMDWESANFRYILKLIMVTSMSRVCGANFSLFFILKIKKLDQKYTRLYVKLF